MPHCEKSQIKLQNCVFRLDLKIDANRLQQYAVLNKSLNCFKLKLKNVTLQIFLTSSCAMCFLKSYNLPKLDEYGLVIKNFRLVTTVYTYKLLSKIVNMNTFYSICRKVTKSVNFEPELFPCLTLKCFGVTVRIFHSGSVIILGAKQEQQLVKAIRYLNDLYFEYSVHCNFENI